eukprot:6188400-Pleurochrysis_carterae.AAC.2
MFSRRCGDIYFPLGLASNSRFGDLVNTCCFQTIACCVHVLSNAGIKIPARTAILPGHLLGSHVSR